MNGLACLPNLLMPCFLLDGAFDPACRFANLLDRAWCLYPFQIDSRAKSKAGDRNIFDYIADDNLAGLQSYVGDLRIKDRNHKTVFMVAAERRRGACLSWLLDTAPLALLMSGNKKDLGKTALMYACLPWKKEGVSPATAGPGFAGVGVATMFNRSEDNAGIAAAILRHLDKAGLNQRSSTGDTALHYACRSGFKKIVKQLLDRADLEVDITNNEGKTAMEVAPEFADMVRDCVRLKRFTLPISS